MRQFSHCFFGVSASITGIGCLVLLYIVMVPQLKRFQFSPGLSLYDLGFYGFGPSKRYLSFQEESPIIEISPANATCDPRYTFLAPRGDSVEHAGPAILDSSGELLWMRSNRSTTQDFKVQRYRGESYLTYWQGDEEDGHGHGSWYMLDSTYAQKFVVSPIGGFDGDLHDFHITVDNTALITIYHIISADLTSIGGPELGWLYDGVFQEIDIATGELIFEWRSSSYYPPNSSYESIKSRGFDINSAFDYFHINSVDKDGQGRYLVSARHTHTITCISGSTGEVLWTLGGKKNEFSDISSAGSAKFAWQHDARWQSPNTLTLLDNAAHGGNDPSAISRGIVLELDIPQRQVTLLKSFAHPKGLATFSQGNVQVLDTGNVLVGWGHSAAYTEFSPDGDVVCDVHFGASVYFNFGRIVSYRVFKDHWVGTPSTKPDVKVVSGSVHVSWNGATEVALWQLESWDGESRENMTFVEICQVERMGFETKIPLGKEIDSFFRIHAIDSYGETLGLSDVLQHEHASLTEFFMTMFFWSALSITIFVLGWFHPASKMYVAACDYSRFWSAPRASSYTLLVHQENDQNDSTCEFEVV